jgi:hypothetical protein
MVGARRKQSRSVVADMPNTPMKSGVTAKTFAMVMIMMTIMKKTLVKCAIRLMKQM